MVKKAGCIICGRRTYEEGLKSGTLLTDQGFHVVLTTNPNLSSSDPRVIITTKSPKEVLGLLEEKGYSKVIIGGGGKLNASFLKDNLIDEIYLDIEPHLFSSGIPVTYHFNSDLELEFIDSNHLGPQTIQLHYRVKK
jgi:dihydrofolate reductase